MNRPWRIVVAAVVIFLAAGCGPAGSALGIEAQEFASPEAIPRIEHWEIHTREPYAIRMEQLGTTDAMRLGWQSVRPGKTEAFSYSVYRFESIPAARDGYKRALRIYRVPGYTADPRREWSYKSDYANRYTTFCGSQETTPGTCISVGRYANYVVVVAFVPGDDVGVEHLPELFGAVDRHVQAVIDSAREP
jgi:hypothetical protein